MNPYVDKSGDTPVITPAGYDCLADIVTDPHGQVYVFKPGASPLAVAATLARTSRSPNDLRFTYLDEFADKDDEIHALLERVVVGFGDDSVQQLLYLQVVTERVSNLATKQLELGRLMAYLEQSTRYIFFDDKANGGYKYHRPTELSQTMHDHFCRNMDRIFDNYSTMVRAVTEFLRLRHPFVPKEPTTEELEASGHATAESYNKALRSGWLAATRAQACDAVRPVLPAATQSSVGIVGSAQSFDELIMRLASEDVAEFRNLGNKLLAQVRQVAPVFFERTDLANRGGAKSAYRRQNRNAMKEVAARMGLRGEIRTTHSGVPNPPRAKLLKYWPQNELDLVTDCLYPYGIDSSYLNVEMAVSNLSREEKENILRQYIGARLNRRHRPGRAFEDAHYKWEILGDYGTFRDIQRHRMVDGMEWPELTPTYGYNIPPLVIEAGFEQLFRECFEISEELYWRMRDAGYGPAAQYATLLGHLMRYKFTENAREAYHIHEIRTTVQGHAGYRHLVLDMHRQVAEVHPLIAAGMRFVGAADTLDLIRLESAVRAEHKLNALDGK